MNQEPLTLGIKPEVPGVKTEQKGPGRPTVMTEEVVKKLEDAFMMGFSDREACLYADISRQTLYDYCNKNPEFTDRKEELKLSPNLHAKKNIVKALEKGDLDTSKWFAQAKMSDEFAVKNKTEHSGSIVAMPTGDPVKQKEAKEVIKEFETKLRDVLIKPTEPVIVQVQEADKNSTANPIPAGPIPTTITLPLPALPSTTAGHIPLASQS